MGPADAEAESGGGGLKMLILFTGLLSALLTRLQIRANTRLTCLGACPVSRSWKAWCSTAQLLRSRPSSGRWSIMNGSGRCRGGVWRRRSKDADSFHGPIIGARSEEHTSELQSL